MLRKRLNILSGVAVCLGTIVAGAAEPRPIAPGRFESLHKMIKPQPGESLFWDVPWLISMREARRKAAAEGKPIVVWSGSGGAPVGVC